MSCYGCACDHCVYSAELVVWEFTPGEVDDSEEVCFTCDECKHWGGDITKRSQWRKDCPKHKYPKKYIEAKAKADRKNAERLAQKCRKAFKVINGGQLK